MSTLKLCPGLGDVSGYVLHVGCAYSPLSETEKPFHTEDQILFLTLGAGP